MSHQIAKTIAQFFCAKDIISKHNIDAYAYGFEILFLSIINWGTILIFMFITQTFFESILYMFVFILLRHHSGGYHADTHLKCFILTISAYITVLIFTVIKWSLFSFIILLSNILFSLVVTIFFAPIEHKNKPVTPNELSMHKKISIILSIFFSTCSLILLLFKQYSLALGISFALSQVGISLLFGMYINKKQEVNL